MRTHHIFTMYQRSHQSTPQPCLSHAECNRICLQSLFLKLFWSFISTGELRRRCFEVNCFLRRASLPCRGQIGLFSTCTQLWPLSCWPCFSFSLSVGLSFMAFSFMFVCLFLFCFMFFLLILLYVQCHLNWRPLQLFSLVCLAPLCELSFWSHLLFALWLFLFLLQFKILALFETHLYDQTLFSSLMGEKQLPGSGHTSNRRLCPHENSECCKTTNYSITDFM